MQLFVRVLQHFFCITAVRSTMAVRANFCWNFFAHTHQRRQFLPHYAEKKGREKKVAVLGETKDGDRFSQDIS